ncbi:hypothetical protein CEXT_751641 [Caerostris extrusa]|uniref:Uncharacterized protein n=1 Tax=Caerostris extrusa TaxID=172846 RepID=A0AAV4NNQ0_CAEEX|nr:hypothetical protein CEXT_751641 [Caerostris extrusa]
MESRGEERDAGRDEEERERAETSIVEGRERKRERRCSSEKGTSAVMKHLLKSDESVKGLGGEGGPLQDCPVLFHGRVRTLTSKRNY